MNELGYLEIFLVLIFPPYLMKLKFRNEKDIRESSESDLLERWIFIYELFTYQSFTLSPSLVLHFSILIVLEISILN